MDYNLRKAFNNLAEIAANCAEFVNFPLDSKDIEQMMQFETASFIGYIAGGSGEITGQDLNILAFYTGIDASFEEFADFISENELLAGEYEYTVPQFLQLLVQFDNILIDKGADMGAEDYISLTYIQMMSGLAKEITREVGRVNFDREENWDVYAKTLTNYVDENLHKTSDDKFDRFDYAEEFEIQ